MENITWVDHMPYIEDMGEMRLLTDAEYKIIEMMEGEQYD